MWVALGEFADEFSQDENANSDSGTVSDSLPSEARQQRAEREWHGAIAALNGPQDSVTAMISTFRERRDATLWALEKIGWHVPNPAATMYLWVRLPGQWQQDSVSFCTHLVEKTGVALAPGQGFGSMGEGYVRFALVHAPDTLTTAIGQIEQFLA